MIQDARVLRDEFVPSEVEHRNAEVNALSAALRPLMDGEQAETAFLHGPSGAGKTCIARHTTERLRERIIDVETVYVNCWQHFTRFRVLFQILDALGRTVDVHRQSTPKDELLVRLREHDGPPVVVVLDEVDQLEDEALLYDLHTLRDVSMILVANREEAVFSGLSERLQSRLHSARRVHFDRYGIEELVGILDARVEWGLRDDAVDADGLAVIADRAAGDARIAISILRNAARHAEANGQERITEAVVDAVTPEARDEVRQKSLDKLSPDQQVVYEIIDETGGIGPAALHDRYAEQVADPVTKRTIRNWLGKMEQYNLVVGSGTNQDREYEVVE